MKGSSREDSRTENFKFESFNICTASCLCSSDFHCLLNSVHNSEYLVWNVVLALLYLALFFWPYQVCNLYFLLNYQFHQAHRVCKYHSIIHMVDSWVLLGNCRWSEFDKGFTSALLVSYVTPSLII